MKKFFLITAVVSMIGFSEIHAQTGNMGTESDKAETIYDNDGPNFSKLDVSPLDVILFRGDNDDPVARVLYSRPQMRDREIFGSLVPYGEVWRTGANEATEITFYTDMMIEGKKIEAGTYTLFTIPKEEEWVIILNNSTHIWGAYDYFQEKDLARITVPVRESPVTIEALSMAFEPTENGMELVIGWADKFVRVPFTNPEKV